MFFQKKGEISFCKWNIFSEYENLIAVFSTKKGGFSKGFYNSLNLGFSTNDSKKDVIENRKIFFYNIDISENKIAWVHQVHGNNIIIAEKCGNLGIGDGLITETSDIFLCGTYADCASILVFEPEKQIAGLFHAGWKGVLKKITIRGIENICKYYNVQPDNLLVGISPHIKQCCYVVKKDVASLFNQKFLKKIDKEHWMLNIENAIIEQLLDKGIKEKNIERSDFCTSCNEDMFFSYRRDKGKTGRMIAVIGIKNHNYSK